MDVHVNPLDLRLRGNDMGGRGDDRMGCGDFTRVSIMVLLPVEDRHRPIDLFQEYDARELMREGHF